MLPPPYFLPFNTWWGFVSPSLFKVSSISSSYLTYFPFHQSFLPSPSSKPYFIWTSTPSTTQIWSPPITPPHSTSSTHHYPCPHKSCISMFFLLLVLRILHHHQLLFFFLIIIFIACVCLSLLNKYEVSKVSNQSMQILCFLFGKWSRFQIFPMYVHYFVIFFYYYKFALYIIYIIPHLHLVNDFKLFENLQDILNL